MLVDAHVHVWPNDAARAAGVDLDGSIDSVHATLETAGIEGVVLIQPGLLGLDHDDLARAVDEVGIRAVAVAQVEPGDDRRSLELLVSLAEDDRFAGFRLPVARGGVDWLSRAWPGYAELAAARGSVVCILAEPDQLESVRAAAESAPSVAVVVDHLGRPDRAADPWDAVARLGALAATPNVYVKVSALPVIGGGWPSAYLGEAIGATVDAFGPERVLWGSDHPFVGRFGRYREWPEAVREALIGRGADVVDAVLGATARRLFFPGPR